MEIEELADTVLVGPEGATPDDVLLPDGVAVGSPTNMGVLSRRMKKFWDEEMGPHSSPAELNAPSIVIHVPGHGLPHPVDDPDGHLHATRDSGHPHVPPISGVALAAPQ